MSPVQTSLLRMSTLGVTLPHMSTLSVKLRLRYRRGAGALVAVLLLAALAGTGLAVHYAAQHAARQTAQAFQAGRVFGEWVLAAHKAAQEHGFTVRLEIEPAFLLTPAVLRGMGAVPPGLPDHVGRDASFRVGVMDDRAGVTGRSPVPGRSPVAMAFGVLEPARSESVPALRRGAIAAGLAALAEAGSAETAMAVHVPAIEAALGRPLASDVPGRSPALYVTADTGLRYRDEILYRRAQPGRPGLNRMETALDAGGNDVVETAAADGFTASVAGDAEAGGSGSVTGDAAAARLEAGSLEAGALGAASLAVSAELLVGRAVSGPVSTGSARVTGRLEAAGLTAVGRLTAGTLATGGTATVTGPASAQSLAGEIATVSGTMRAGRIASTGLHGPDASIDAVTVGSCGGC